MRVYALVSVLLVGTMGCGGSSGTPDATSTTDGATSHDAVSTDAPLMMDVVVDAGPPTGCVFPDGSTTGDAMVSVGDGGWHETSYHGRLGVPLPAGLNGGALTATVTVNGVSGPPLLVDTGSAVTYLAPSLFPGAMVPTGCGTVSDFAVAGLDFTGVPVIGDDDAGGGGVAGNLGVDILSQFIATFDFRCQMLDLGGAYPTLDVTTPGATVPFTLLGGGMYPGCAQVFPEPTRMIVSVNIEGSMRSMVVDTGNSFIQLIPSVYSTIVADGRAQLSVMDATVESVPLQVTRLRTVSIGSASTTNLAAFEMDPGVAAGIASELGASIDGFVGVNYLREFLVTANYPAGTLTLQRFTNEDHIHDEFVRVGMMLAFGEGNGYVVGQVFPGTDVQDSGVGVGAPVVSVDDVPLAGLGIDEADGLLRGTVGQTRMIPVVIGTTTYHFRVNNLLPPGP